MRERLATFEAILRSPALRRVEAALLGFSVAEWATWIAVVVYAFARGGATEAALISSVQLIPSILVAPTAASLGDRFPRGRVLLGSYAAQALAMAATAVAMAVGPPLVAYTLVTVTFALLTITRPVHASFLPTIVESPEELTAANVVSGTIEGAGAFIGPVAAGVLVALGGPPAVYVAMAIATGLGAVAVLPVWRHEASFDPTDVSGALDADDGTSVDIRRELAAGVATIARDGRLRWLVMLLAVTSVVVGALDIFYAVLAIDVLGADESAIGFLGAATGAGTLAGSAAAVGLVGRQRLAGSLVLSAFVFGIGVAVAGLTPELLPTVLALVVAGAGSAVVYVAIQTATQRVAGDDVMNRVFGVEEAVMMAASCVGALVVPILLSTLQPSGAMIVVGLSLPAAAALAGLTLLRIDRSGQTHARELAVLQRMPMFGPLSGPVLERLAAGAATRLVETGERLVTAGEPGDTFFVIASGAVEVVIPGDDAPRTLGTGASFGEIALLRDVPRTATVVATEPTELVVLGRGPFLEALTGQPRSRWLATRMADERLADRVR